MAFNRIGKVAQSLPPTGSHVDPPAPESRPPAIADAFHPAAASVAPRSEAPREHPVRQLPLEGPLAAKDAEISGMAWHGDELVLLPQRPQHWDPKHPTLFGLRRDELARSIGGDPTPLRPHPIPLEPKGFADAFPGFDGFEAIAFHGDHAYLLVEAKPFDDPSTPPDASTSPLEDVTVSWLVQGQLVDGKLKLDLVDKRFLGQHSQLRNLAFEGLCVMKDKLVVLGELNAAPANPGAKALAFDFDLKPLGALPMPQLQYRLTDSTPADQDGRFWVSNYKMDDCEYPLGPDAEVAKYGQGPTHAAAHRVGAWSSSRSATGSSSSPPGRRCSCSSTPPAQGATGKRSPASTPRAS